VPLGRCDHEAMMSVALESSRTTFGALSVENVSHAYGAYRPRMLVLDETTPGLDIEARAAILKVVRGLAADEGIGVLWATHLVDEVRDEDHVVVLHKGRVLADGPSRSIIGGAGARSIGEAFTSLTGD